MSLKVLLELVELMTFVMGHFVLLLLLDVVPGVCVGLGLSLDKIAFPLMGLI